MTLPPDDFSNPEPPDNEPPADMHHQQFQVPGATARMPPDVGNGQFSTGAIVMTVQHAFVMDFLQQMSVPATVVSRVVLPHAVMPQFVKALEANIKMYEDKFGSIPAMPKPPQPPRKPSIQEIYENLKLPDNEMPGHYADGVVIRHSPAEFCFDFITHFYPHAAVARRLFVAAPHVPQILKTMTANLNRFLEQRNQQGGQGGPPQSGPDQPPGPGQPPGGPGQPPPPSGPIGPPPGNN